MRLKWCLVQSNENGISNLKRIFERNVSVSSFSCTLLDAASAIEKRMQKSRRLIILLTQQLINSKEDAYDQHIALYNALIQNDAKVILLEMETIGAYGKLQESLRFIIKQQGTIKWKEEHTVHPQSPNSKFWKQVRYNMPLTCWPSHSAHTRWTLLDNSAAPSGWTTSPQLLFLSEGTWLYSLDVWLCVLNFFQSFSLITMG